MISQLGRIPDPRGFENRLDQALPPMSQPKKKPPGFAGRFLQNVGLRFGSTGDGSVEAGLEVLLGLQAHGLLDHLAALED